MCPSQLDGSVSSFVQANTWRGGGRGRGRRGDASCQRLFIAQYSYYILPLCLSTMCCTLCNNYISSIDINLCNSMQRGHCLPSKAFEGIERWPE